MGRIIKISVLCLCAILLIIELVILINSNKIFYVSTEPFENSTTAANELKVPDISETKDETHPTVSIDIDITDTNVPDEMTEIAETTELIEVIEVTETTEAEKIELTEPPIIIETTPEPETVHIEETEPIQETEEETTAAPNVEPETGKIYEPAPLIYKDVPILMYHTSSEAEPVGLRGLYVKPSQFEKQMQYLVNNNYTFCTFDDYYNLDNIEKPVFITFDDGYRENYTEIYPILKKYNAKITIFLIINSISNTGLTKDMIVEMSDSGLVKFESHTMTHPSLVATSSNDKMLTDQLKISKEIIEEITGKPVIALCYPNGEFNDKVLAKTKEYYWFGVRKDLGMHNTIYDPYEVRRIRVDRDTSLQGFIRYVGG